MGVESIVACSAFEPTPGVFQCHSGPAPVPFDAKTVTLEDLVGTSFQVDAGDLAQADVHAFDGLTSAVGVPINYSITGAAIAQTPLNTTTDSSGFGTLQFQVSPSAAEGSVITVTAVRPDHLDVPPVVITFTVNTYELNQVSPADGNGLQANSTTTLTVEALYNGGPPNGENASRTIQWEIIADPNSNATLTGGLTSTTSQVGSGDTIATIDLTVGAPNLNSGMIVVRATAFPPMLPRGAGVEGPPGGNVRIVEFQLDPFDVLAMSAVSGSGQTADVGAPVADPLVTNVTRNGSPDTNRLVDWSVTPPNAVTFSNGMSTAQSSITATGDASISISSVNTGGAITIHANHNDDPTTSASFTLTGTNATLGFDSIGGSGQTAQAGQPFDSPLTMRVLSGGAPEENVLIDWSVSPANGAVLGNTQTTSNVNGFVSNTVTAGSIDGPVTVTAARNDDPTVVQTFLLGVVSTPILVKPTQGSGDGQTGFTGDTLPQPLVVVALNNGQPRGNVLVNWSVTGDAILSDTQTQTAPDGHTSITVTFGQTPGTVTVTAARDDAPAATASFVLTSTLSNDVRTIELPPDSGNGSSGPPGAEIELQALTRRNGVNESDVQVNWSLVAGDARLRLFNTDSNPSGIARNTVTLGTRIGPVRIRAARADRPNMSVLYVLNTVPAGTGEQLTIVEGNSQVGAPGATGQPLGVRYLIDDVPAANAGVSWSVVSGSATLDAPASTTDANGVARVGFRFGTTPGPVTVRASVGNSQVDFALTVEGPPSSGVALRLVGGSGQTGVTGTRADLPIVVEVLDADGDPVAGRRIDWIVFSGSATLDAPSTDTDENGRASQGFVFGPDAGPIVIHASLSSSAQSRIEILATGFAPTLSIVSGNNQSAPVSTLLPQDLVVAIAPPPGRAKSLAGVVVTWQVAEGGGSLASATSTTGSDGRASNRLTLGANPGVNRVTASVAGAGSVTFNATGTAVAGPLTIVSGNAQNLPTGTPSAPLLVELRNAAGQPIAGATLDWSATNATFVDGVTTTTTDAQGRSSNRVEISLPGAAGVTARVQGNDANRVVFSLTGGVANLPSLGAPVGTIAEAIDRLCPALVSMGNLTPAQLDLRARCLELVNNAGDRPDQVRNALEQMREDVALAQADAALMTTAAQHDNLKMRLTALRHGAKGVDVNGLALGTPTGTIPLSFLPSSTAQDDGSGEGGSEADVGADFGRWGFFASGTIGRGEHDATSLTPEYDFDTSGLTAGVDYRVNDNWVVGASLGFNQQDTDIGEDGGGIDTQGWSVSGYTTWFNENNWYLDGVLGFGSNDYDLRRSIVYEIAGASGTTQVDQVARASTGGDQLSLVFALGRDFQKGPWSFGPYLRGTYTRIDFDSFEERLDSGPGSGLGFAVESRELKSRTGVLGAKVTYAMSRDWGVLVPQAQVEWEHEFSDDPQHLIARFLHDPTSTPIISRGDEVDTDYYNIGFGLSALFPGGRSAFVYYEHLAGSEGLSQDNLSLGVRIEF